MIRNTSFTCLAILLVSQAFSQQKTYQATWESIDSRPVPSWFENSKFGIFIHWGLYSVPSWGPTEGNIYEKYAEWYWRRQDPDTKPVEAFTEFHNTNYGEKFRYQDFVTEFRAEMFRPEKWAEIFRESGAKYVVLTSKHHEGFTLWPSAQSWNWNSVDAGPHRDLCGDLIRAVRGAGLRMGFYYSLYEWFNPIYRSDVTKYVDEHMLPQMKDLVTRYSPDILWTDGEWDHPSDTWKSTEFLAWLFNESPVREYVAVNDRWGKETRGKHGGYFTTEYDLVHDGDARGTVFERPWEECRGIGGSFGYNRNENLEDYSTSRELIHILINKVARGGNLLLNIGPTSDGRIPVIMQQRLSDIGTWLKTNGEAIYNTRKWEKAPDITSTTDVYFTKKDNDLYVLVTKWQESPFVVNGTGRPETVSMPGYGGNIRYSYSANRITIYPPQLTPLTNPGNYAWVYKLENSLK